ncbi:MAG: DUF3823 domain-containing protein [Prevotellaceae bacterium]|jgi:hypothetical protein|nr:DUF3823 domain-containing protein [Prevotellaceae bacterium]
MKTLIKVYVLAILIAVTAASCGKDNYDKPESHFTGKVTYNGQALGVRGSNGSVYLQFWQDGYELKTSFNVYVTQDGTYSSMLSDGVYKLVTASGNGPWVSAQDTVIVTVNGDTQKDYEVTPYYTLSNINYSVSGNTLTASFDVASVTTDRAIEYVALMVNKTQFVDFGDGTHVNWVRNSEATPGRVELQLDISNDLANQKALYARVGLKIDGVGEGVYDTNVYKIK